MKREGVRGREGGKERQIEGEREWHKQRVPHLVHRSRGIFVRSEELHERVLAGEISLLLFAEAGPDGVGLLANILVAILIIHGIDGMSTGSHLRLECACPQQPHEDEPAEGP
jgi:hypothetical protein